MKEGWINSRIGDICSITDFVSNGSFASLRENVKYYNSPNYAVLVRLADASNGFDKSKFVYTDEHGYDFSKKSHLHGGELIMSNVGSVGSMFICPVMAQPMTLAPNTISITSQNNKFLYYYFLSDGFKKKLKGITSSTTLKKFNKTNFKLLEIPIPPLSEQQSIVNYLDSAFAKIDAMKGNAEKALNEAKALFQASLKEMLEPKEGWEEMKVKELSLLITKGSSPKWQGNSYVNSDGILFVTSENVREGRLELNPKKFVDNSFNIKQRRSILKKFDVLVNIVGASIGRAAVFDLDVENANINQAVCLIRLDRDKMLPAYLCYFLNSEHAFKQYASMVKDTARANLSLENIGSLEIGIPPLSEQQSIVDTLDSLKSKVDRLQANFEKISQECDALKQALLRQVFE